MGRRTREKRTMDPINPHHIRYIKLGAAGRWAKQAIDNGELPFGYPAIPHDLCLSGDWHAVTRAIQTSLSWPLKAARRGAGELEAFYTLGPDCLWVTFEDAHLWWCYAELAVTVPAAGAPDAPSRLRLVRGGWNNKDLHGVPLRMDGLSTRLTQTAGYRGTVCTVGAADYLVRRSAARTAGMSLIA